MTLPAFAAEHRAAGVVPSTAGGAVAAERRRLLLVDISCSPGAQQQTRWPALLTINADRRTDGRTLHRFRDPDSILTPWARK